MTCIRSENIDSWFNTDIIFCCIQYLDALHFLSFSFVPKLIGRQSAKKEKKRKENYVGVYAYLKMYIWIANKQSCDLEICQIGCATNLSLTLARVRATLILCQSPSREDEQFRGFSVDLTKETSMQSLSRPCIHQSYI